MSAGAVREALRSLDPKAPVNEITTMEDLLSAWLAPRRFTLTVLGLFAGIALLLAIVGIYGVLSYLITQRTREIGIRVALGADTSTILASVTREALAWSGCGSAIGIGASLSLGR
jgi:putative ABC transport system permease protein